MLVGLRNSIPWIIAVGAIQMYGGKNFQCKLSLLRNFCEFTFYLNSNDDNRLEIENSCD